MCHSGSYHGPHYHVLLDSSCHPFADAEDIGTAVKHVVFCCKRADISTLLLPDPPVVLQVGMLQTLDAMLP